MDKEEAGAIAGRVVKGLRAESHAALVERLLNRPEATEIVGNDGTIYQVESEAFWDAGQTWPASSGRCRGRRRAQSARATHVWVHHLA